MSEERQSSITLMRDTDRWLRRMAFYGPAIGVIIGWQLGFMNAAWMFRDHEKRITAIESWHVSHDTDERKNDAEYQGFEAVVKERLHLR